MQVQPFKVQSGPSHSSYCCDKVFFNSSSRIRMSLMGRVMQDCYNCNSINNELSCKWDIKQIIQPFYLSLNSLPLFLSFSLSIFLTLLLLPLFFLHSALSSIFFQLWLCHNKFVSKNYFVRQILYCQRSFFLCNLFFVSQAPTSSLSSLAATFALQVGVAPTSLVQMWVVSLLSGQCCTQLFFDCFSMSSA